MEQSICPQSLQWFPQLHVYDATCYNFCMAQRDAVHDTVKQALIKDGWEITDDPYVITYGERLLFVDLGAEENQGIVGNFIGAERANLRIIEQTEVKKWIPERPTEKSSKM